MQTEHRKYVESFEKQGLVPMTLEHWLDAQEMAKRNEKPAPDGWDD